MASSGVVILDGTLEAGPPAVTSGVFPRGATSLPVQLRSGSTGKSAPLQTGDMVTELASSGAFVALDGIGTGKSVPKANFLLAQTAVPMQLRLTMKDPGGGADLVSVLPINGPLLVEFDDAGYLKGLEAKGSGTVNWYASGSQ